VFADRVETHHYPQESSRDKPTDDSDEYPQSRLARASKTVNNENVLLPFARGVACARNVVS
jgi:hypothetical protein